MNRLRMHRDNARRTMKLSIFFKSFLSCVFIFELIFIEDSSLRTLQPLAIYVRLVDVEAGFYLLSKKMFLHPS